MRFNKLRRLIDPNGTGTVRVDEEERVMVSTWLFSTGGSTRG